MPGVSSAFAFKRWDFPAVPFSSSRFGQEQTGTAASSLAGSTQGSWDVLALRRHLRNMGRWRKRRRAGKEGSSGSSRLTRLEEQTTGRWEPAENGDKPNGSPKGQPLHHESVTHCRFLCLHPLESSSSLGYQALFRCFSASQAICFGKPKLLCVILSHIVNST